MVGEGIVTRPDSSVISYGCSRMNASHSIWDEG